MINHKFISFSAVQIYDLSYIQLHFSPSTGILGTHKVTSFLMVAQLKEHCRRSGLYFFQAFISQLLMLGDKFISFSAVQMYDLLYIHLQTLNEYINASVVTFGKLI